MVLPRTIIPTFARQSDEMHDEDDSENDHDDNDEEGYENRNERKKDNFLYQRHEYIDC